MQEGCPPALIGLLACPDCQSDLCTSREGVKCPSCRREFEVRNEIPILMPSDLDMSHLRKEEDMAGVMTAPKGDEQERFAAGQWAESRKVFWEVVAQNIDPAPKKLLNVGCGYDDSFLHFQNKGYFFVNFDIVYEMLETLKQKHGARNCVAGDVKSLPFRKNTFDYIACIDMLHHEHERLEMLLERISSLIRSGGTLFLEDVNAWGMFQFPKSIFMTRSMHRSLRSFYYRNLKHSDCGPADYEFPTNPFKVKRILENNGFSDFSYYKNYSYPSCTKRTYRFYRAFANNERIAKFHNYQYLMKARKK